MKRDALADLVSLEGVPSGFAAARDGLDAVLRDRGLRRTAPETTAESLLRGAHASAALAGSDRTLAQVREGDLDPVAAAAVRLSTEVLALVPVVQRAPVQAFARLHAVVAAGLEPAERLGRPRDAEAAQRLQRLAAVLTAPTEAPAMLVAAVVHGELLDAAPFGTHDDLVARAAERLVLVARGVDPRSVTVPEAGHLALRASYERVRAGYAAPDSRGVHAWLLHCAEAYAAGAEASPLRRAAE